MGKSYQNGRGVTMISYPCRLCGMQFRKNEEDPRVQCKDVAKCRKRVLSGWVPSKSKSRSKKPVEPEILEPEESSVEKALNLKVTPETPLAVASWLRSKQGELAKQALEVAKLALNKMQDQLQNGTLGHGKDGLPFHSDVPPMALAAMLREVRPVIAEANKKDPEPLRDLTMRVNLNDPKVAAAIVLALREQRLKEQAAVLAARTA